MTITIVIRLPTCTNCVDMPGHDSSDECMDEETAGKLASYVGGCGQNRGEIWEKEFFLHCTNLSVSLSIQGGVTPLQLFRHLVLGGLTTELDP